MLVPKATDFRIAQEGGDVTIQELYAALTVDESRNQGIVADVLEAVHNGLTPLVLTNRTDHLDRLAAGWSTIENVFILKGRMGAWARSNARQRRTD